LFEQVDRGVDDLAEVVRRDVRRHADGDPCEPFTRRFGKRAGKHNGLFVRAGEVRDEIDGPLVEALEHAHRQHGEATLGVTHGGRPVIRDLESRIRRARRSMGGEG
jgi:hypothetical protein